MNNQTVFITIRVLVWLLAFQGLLSADKRPSHQIKASFTESFQKSRELQIFNASELRESKQATQLEESQVSDNPEVKQGLCNFISKQGVTGLNLGCLSHLSALKVEQSKLGFVPDGIELELYSRGPVLARELVLGYPAALRYSSFANALFYSTNWPSGRWFRIRIPFSAFKNPTDPEKEIEILLNTPELQSHYERNMIRGFHPVWSLAMAPERLKLTQDYTPFLSNLEGIYLSRASLYEVEEQNAGHIASELSALFQLSHRDLFWKFIFLLLLPGLIYWLVRRRRSIQLYLLIALVSPIILYPVLFFRPIEELIERLDRIQLHRQEQKLVRISEEFEREMNARLQSWLDSRSRLLSEVKAVLSTQQKSRNTDIPQALQNCDHLLERTVSNRKEIDKLEGLNFSNSSLFSSFLLQLKKECEGWPESHRSYEINMAYNQDSPLLRLLQEKLKKEGLSIYLSSHSTSYKSKNISSSFHLVSPLYGYLLRMLHREVQEGTSERMDFFRSKAKEFLELRDLLVSSGLDLEKIDGFLGDNNRWWALTGNRLSDFPKQATWNHLKHQGELYIVLMEFEQEGFFLRFFNELKVEMQKRYEGIELSLIGEDLHPSFPVVPQDSFTEQLGRLSQKTQKGQHRALVSQGKVIQGYARVLEGMPNYSLVLKTDSSSSFSLLSVLKELILLGVLALALLIFYLSNNLGYMVYKPLSRLKKGVQEIAAGNYLVRIDNLEMEELNSLASQFNEMAVQLRKGQELTGFLARQSRESILESDSLTRREEVSILFCGFRAPDSGELPPEKLELWIPALQTLIHEQSGIVDKFTGQALLAIFEGPGKEKHALDCALQIRSYFLNQKISEGYRSGIGISTGSVILGQIGAQKRMDFTCIGDTVNLSARIQYFSYKLERSVSIVCDKTTKNDVPEQQFKVHDQVSFAGKEQKMSVYEVIA